VGTRAEDPDRSGESARVLALLRRYGWNATSFQTLEEGFRYWFDGDQACVTYVDTGAAWVAAGAPIAPPDRLGAIAERFAAAAAGQGRRAVFFATEARFLGRTRFRSQLIGEQPVWDPAVWPDTVAGTGSLRVQLRRARNKGVSVRLLGVADLVDPGSPARAAIEALIGRWLASRPLAPMGFLVGVQLFSHPEERRTFVAERDGRVVGLLSAVPVYARGGWLFEDLLRDHDAPNGTAELLIDTAMRVVAAEGSRYATLGLAPLAGATSGWLGLVRRWAASLYDFRGVPAFRAKLRPHGWDHTVS
jgi:phosphatidylglycerol lysyltransferase